MLTVELFSGTKSFSKVASSLGYDTYTIDNNESLKPSRCIDILTIEYLPPDIYFLWASPPCQSFSVASISKNWKEGKPQ